METGLQEQRLGALATEINTIKDQVRQTALISACEIGKRLIEVKNMLRHGAFGEWLRDNVDYSERDAQRLMQVFDKYGRSPIEGAEKLSISQAMALISAPEDVRREMIESGEAAEMSVRELKAEVDRMREEIEGRQMTIDTLTDDLKRERGKYANALDAAQSSAKREGDLRKERDKYKQMAKDAEAQADNAAQPVIQQVEVVPAEVEEELRRLRAVAAKAPDEATILIREYWSEVAERMRKILTVLPTLDGEGRGKYRVAITGGLRAMLAKIEDIAE